MRQCHQNANNHYEDPFLCQISRDSGNNDHDGRPVHAVITRAGTANNVTIVSQPRAFEHFKDNPKAHDCWTFVQEVTKHTIS
jgi:hypothetical protein